MNTKKSVNWGLRIALVFAVAIAATYIEGCDDSNFQKAARAAAGISTTLNDMEQATETSYGAGLVDRNEAIAITRCIKDTSLANDHFVARLRQLDKIDEHSAAQLAQYAADVAASVDRLNGTCVIPIHDPDVRAKLTLGIGTIQAALKTLAEILKQYPIQAAPANALRADKVWQRKADVPVGRLAGKRDGTLNPVAFKSRSMDASARALEVAST